MTARKMPVRTHEFNLNGDWTGWNFTAKVNIPLGTFERLQTGKFTEITDVLAGILIDWNFVDESGEPLKAIRKEQGENGKEIEMEVVGPCLETVRLLPVDLGTIVLREITTYIRELPNN